jgi:hypothetical protein
MHIKKDFERTPKFTKLSLLFQQCILILKMEGLKDHLPTELHSKLFILLINLSFFEQDYKVYQTDDLKKDLETYKRKLRPMIQHSRNY